MAKLVTVASISDVSPGQAKAVQVEGRTIALFNIGGTYYAIDDSCTHQGGPLSEGEVEGTTVTCPLHAARFDVTSGAVLGPPASEAVKSYKVHIQDNEIKLEF